MVIIKLFGVICYWNTICICNKRPFKICQSNIQKSLHVVVSKILKSVICQSVVSKNLLSNKRSEWCHYINVLYSCNCNSFWLDLLFYLKLTKFIFVKELATIWSWSLVSISQINYCIIRIQNPDFSHLKNKSTLESAAFKQENNDHDDVSIPSIDPESALLIVENKEVSKLHITGLVTIQIIYQRSHRVRTGQDK